MASVYVASSWRNRTTLDATIAALRGDGHDVYDFRADEYFEWTQCDPGWDPKTPIVATDRILNLLRSEPAERGFESDMRALRSADVVVLAMPCGRSAHLELGWAAGAGKPCAVYMVEPCEPELMWKMATIITDELLGVLDFVNAEHELIYGGPAAA